MHRSQNIRPGTLEDTLFLMYSALAGTSWPRPIPPGLFSASKVAASRRTSRFLPLLFLDSAPDFLTVSPDTGIGASSSDRGRQTSHHYKMAFPTWTTTTCYVRILYTYHLEPVSWILLVMTSQKSCKNTMFCKADFSLQELLFKIALLCIFLLKSGLPLFWP